MCSQSLQSALTCRSTQAHASRSLLRGAGRVPMIFDVRPHSMRIFHNWSRTKKALLLVTVLALSVFFLSWFMQTVWLSSLAKDNSLVTAVWAYFLLVCAFLLLFFAVYVSVLLYRRTR